MHSKVVAALLVSALCNLAAGVTIDVENGVYKLEDGTFDTVVKKFPAVMVKFYAPWCGHCKELAPVFEKAAKKLKKIDASDAGARLAKVDATVAKTLAEKFDVSSYPTLLVFKHGELFGKYSGGRDKDDLVGYMSAMVMEPAPLGMAARGYYIVRGLYKEALRKVGVPGHVRKYLFKAFPAVIGLPVVLFVIGVLGMLRGRGGSKTAPAPSQKTEGKAKRPARSESPAPTGEASSSGGDGSAKDDGKDKDEGEKKDD